LAAKRRKTPSAAEPQPKEFRHGFHGFHGLEMVSDQTTLIREIRAIRGKILAKMSDSGGLRCKKTKQIVASVYDRR
jgi:hypothetical protein